LPDADRYMQFLLIGIGDHETAHYEEQVDGEITVICKSLDARLYGEVTGYNGQSSQTPQRV